MTVKELKEKLELLIEDGKEDYAVFVNIYCAEYEIFVDEEKRKCIYNVRG